MDRINAKVIYDLLEEIAEKLEKKHRFKEDPELYLAGMLIAAKKGLARPGRTVGQVLEEASFEDNQEEAAKLLGRKKAATC